MSFSGKISKRKNSGEVLLGTFMVPAAFSAASQSVSAVSDDTARILNNQSSGSRLVSEILGCVIFAGIVLLMGAALFRLYNKSKELQNEKQVLNNTVEDLQSKNNELQKKEQELNNTVEGLQNKERELNNTVKDLQNENKVLNEVLLKKESDLRNIVEYKNQALDKEIKELRNKNDELQDEKRELNEVLLKKDNELNGLREKNEELQKVDQSCQDKNIKMHISQEGSFQIEPKSKDNKLEIYNLSVEKNGSGNKNSSLSISEPNSFGIIKNRKSNVVFFSNVFYTQNCLSEVEEGNVITSGEFLEKFRKYVGSAYKVKKDDLLKFLEIDVDEDLKGKLENSDLFIKINGVEGSGRLIFVLVNEDGEELTRNLCTKFATKCESKIDELIKQLKKNDVSVDVLGYFGSVFNSNNQLLMEKDKGDHFHRKLSPFVGKFFPLKKREIVNITRIQYFTEEKPLESYTRDDENLFIKIEEVWRDGRLLFRVFSADNKEVEVGGGATLISGDPIETGPSTCNMDKVDDLAGYLNNKVVDLEKLPKNFGEGNIVLQNLKSF